MMILVFFHSISNAVGSRAMVEKINLPDLEVSWDKNLSIKYLALNNREIFKPNGAFNLKMKRVTFPTEELNLIVIFNDSPLYSSQYAPHFIDVEKTINKIHISKKDLKPIESDSLWLVGKTHKSHCSDSYVSVDARFLTQRSHHRGVNGLFAWELKKSKLPEKKIVHLSMPSHDMASKVESKIMFKANEQYHQSCRSYYGGECKFLFLIKDYEYGNAYEIKFEKDSTLLSLSRGNCPV